MRFILVMFALATLALAAGADSFDDHRRAGFPQEVRRHAHPSDTGRFTGYQVGGGRVLRGGGDGPAANEGTWGWDYTGGWFKRHVAPSWWHGRRHQGGVGAYQAEGPTLLPRLK